MQTHSRRPWTPCWLRWTFFAFVAFSGCGETDPEPSITANVCGDDAPRFRGLCVITADEIHFKHTGPARSFTVVRTVNSAGKPSFEKIPEGNGALFKYFLDKREPFAKYSLFFAGKPELNLEFYHGTRIKPLNPKPAGTDGMKALWWVSDDGQKATRMTYNGAGSIAETYDLKTFEQTGSYDVDTLKLFPYGKHMLLRYSPDRKKVERFFPEGNTAATLIAVDSPIHSFFWQANRTVVQTEDGTISWPALGLSKKLPLVHMAYADNYGVVAWLPGAGCRLSLMMYDWGGAGETLAAKSGLCNPFYGFSFFGNSLFGVVLQGEDDGGVFFGTRDLSAAWNFTGSMIYTDDTIGVAKTNRLEYAYANGTVLADQGLLECAAGAQDMNPNAGISLFYDTGTVLVDDIPEHFSELTTHQNIKTCFGY